jgi:hypothetical protein
MGTFIEETILNSVKMIFLGRVNELLGEVEFMIPPIEFGQSGYTGLPGEFRQGRNSMSLPLGGHYAITPAVVLAECERSEKERVIRLDCFTVSVSFACCGEFGERNCYAYAAAVDRALGEDPTLGGVASRAELAGKKYAPPKHPGTGEGWEVVLSLRVVVEAGRR